jgi:hypothetical protein
MRTLNFPGLKRTKTALRKINLLRRGSPTVLWKYFLDTRSATNPPSRQSSLFIVEKALTKAEKL